MLHMLPNKVHNNDWKSSIAYHIYCCVGFEQCQGHLRSHICNSSWYTFSKQRHFKFGRQLDSGMHYPTRDKLCCRREIARCSTPRLFRDVVCQRQLSFYSHTFT